MVAQTYCIDCGRALRPGQQFCSFCGTARSDELASARHPNAGTRRRKWLLLIALCIIVAFSSLAAPAIVSMALKSGRVTPFGTPGAEVLAQLDLSCQEADRWWGLDWERVIQALESAPIGSPCAQGPPDRLVEAYLKHAAVLSREEKIDQAKQWLERANLLQPGNPAGVSQLRRIERYLEGTQAAAVGEWSKAIDLLQQIYAESPGYANVEERLYFALVSYARKLIDTDDRNPTTALQLLEKAIKVRPADETAPSWYAEAEIRATLHAHDLARDRALGRSYDTTLLAQTTVNPRLNELMSSANRYRSEGSYYEYETRGIQLTSLTLMPTSLNPSQAEVLLSKNERRVLIRPGRSRCDIDEVYQVRYTLQRSAGAWYISTAQALGGRSDC